MKILHVVVICFSLAALFTSCSRKVVKNADADKLKECILMDKIGDALTDRVLLTEIREGRITNAINILEYSIDCSILVMTHETNYDLATQQQVLQTLHLLKEYRLKYPRKFQSTISEDNEVKEMLETSKMAEAALEKIQ